MTGVTTRELGQTTDRCGSAIGRNTSVLQGRSIITIASRKCRNGRSLASGLNGRGVTTRRPILDTLHVSVKKKPSQLEQINLNFFLFPPRSSWKAFHVAVIGNGTRVIREQFAGGRFGPIRRPDRLPRRTKAASVGPARSRWYGHFSQQHTALRAGPSARRRMCCQFGQFRPCSCFSVAHFHGRCPCRSSQFESRAQ